jgi:methylated-DNA-[protein]-cysteine S-methyltransferase
MDLAFDQVRSPIGTIALVANDGALCALDFEDCRARMMGLLAQRFGTVRLTRAKNPGGFTSRVQAYLDGTLDALDDIPVDTGGTAFQRRVWSRLRAITCGTTLSYGELATSIGRPKAVRAVGTTNGRNPVALVVPCHRVIGADGSLTGYAGGLERKRWLLRHEGVALA